MAAPFISVAKHIHKCKDDVRHAGALRQRGAGPLLDQTGELGHRW